jgi:hypothetical protein
LQISRAGEPVLRARTADVAFSLPDLLPGSKHRFGLLGVTIDRPAITIIHHADGTYNLVLPGAGGTPGRPVPFANAIPLALTVRIRDGSAALIDRYRYYSSSRMQQISGVNVDATIDTGGSTTYTVTGNLQDGGAQPFRIAGLVDARAGGYAIHHVTIRAAPIRTLANYFINSPAARVLGGTVRRMDMRAWRFGSGRYRLSGSGMLAGGRIYVRALASPIEHLTGRIILFDSGFTASRLTGRVGHMPIVCAGGLFNFQSPQFRLGVEGHGDLRYLKDVLASAKGLPIFGGVEIHALIEGAVAQPLLLIAFDGKRFNYGAVPIDDPHGTVGLYAGNLAVLPFHAVYDGLAMLVHGNVQLAQQVHSVLAVQATGSSALIPYLGALVPKQQVLTETLLRGDDLKVDARGYISSLPTPANVNGFFYLNRLGVGTFGPIAVRAPGNGSLTAGFSLDRPHGQSAFWVSASNLHLHQPSTIVLPGVNVPPLPPIDARVTQADIAGAGSAANVVIGGRVRMAPATIVGVPFYHIAANFAGPFAASRMSAVRADGPWGTFAGSGTFGTGVIAARGSYAGTLQGLHMFLGPLAAQGAVRGPMAIAIARGKIYVQAENARLQDATIHGIPIASASGTMSFENGTMRIYSAQAQAAGGTVVAAGTFATTPNATPTRLAFATGELNAAELKGFGVPLTGGKLRSIAAISPGGAIPNVDAGVLLSGGTARGYGPFGISAKMRIVSDTLHLRDAVASFGSTFASVAGTIGGLANSVPSYDLRASVPVGDIDQVARVARVPAYAADGSFDANVRIAGSGNNPRVAGTIAVPIGEVNGLGFRNAVAAIALSRGSATAQRGTITIGSTPARFSAAVAPGAVAFTLHSPHADLSDFNDYFDTGDTLAGKGSVALAFSHVGRITFTSGNIDVAGLRYRALPIGDTDANWTGLRNVVQGTVAVGGAHGTLHAAGTIAFAPSTNIARVVTKSSYDLTGTLSNLDLGTWLPAFGFPQLPVTGRIAGSARVQGTYPHLRLKAQAAIHRGTIGPLPIENAEVTAESNGNERISVTRLLFALPELQATGSGDFGWAPDAPIHLQLHAFTADLPGLIAQLSKRRFDIGGSFESTVNVGGTFKAPTVVAGVDGTGITAFGLKVPSFVGQLQVHRKAIVLRNAEVSFPHGTAALAGNLPLQLQPFAFGPAAAPIAMDVTAQGIDLSDFDAIAGSGTQLGGTLNGHFGISGTAGNPQIFGTISTSGASYVSPLETVPITATVAQLTFAGSRATLNHLTAKLGYGTLTGSGSLSFGGGLHGGPLGYAISLATRGAQIDLPAYGSATLDSQLRLQRHAGRLAELQGKVAISNALIPFSAFLKLSGAQTPSAVAAGQPPAPGFPFNLGFNLGITAGRDVRVQGGNGLFGLDLSGQGAVHLAGTLEQPAMDGRFISTGGTLTYIDHAFRLEHAQVSFEPANGALPDVFAVATTHVLDPDPNTARNPTGYADITATVTGTVPDVKVKFTSNPPGYTDQQIIALLLPFSGLAGIQFTQTGVILPSGTGTVAGAPTVPSSGALPNIFEVRQNGTVTITQEAFNILNTQFAAGILSPIESALSSTLGLSDLNLTVGSTGAGLSIRRLLGNNFYALYGTTFTVPERQTFGFAYQPNAFTAAQFSIFWQQGQTPLFQSAGQTISTNARAAVGQPLQGSNGFTFLFQRLF